ncbi:hypothetical protein LTR37_018142 [Vermiconidia calcicola]|uniref:Uncharacterized protein n=1 Tax=Vermiconidia calcicola TaxID=1690605 RepID=A0ACC3MI03_9PEZI|nr:hypothetical protein LTR37_018142 [Vermiconidia calcicola]
MDESNQPRSPQLHPPGMIYHILTECPTIKDYTGFGPFHNIEATVPSILGKLEAMSPSGFKAFQEVLPQWKNGGIPHFRAPLESEDHVTIRLVDEYNPDVAAILPGPAWTVKRSKVLLGPERNTEPEGVTEFEVVETFLEKEKAFEAARRGIADHILGMQGAVRREEGDELGNLHVVGASRDMGIGWQFDASFDSSDIVDGRKNNEPLLEKVMARMYALQMCLSCEAEEAVDGNALKRCARCRMALYCGRECQKADYEQHKPICNTLANIAAA